MNLTDAKAAIEKKPSDVSAATQFIVEANKNIEEAFQPLKLIGDWTVAWRSESFLNGIEKQSEEIKDQLDKAEKKDVKVDDLKAQLTKAQELIQDARVKLLASNKKGALSEIKEARDILHYIMKDLANKRYTIKLNVDDILRYN